MNFETAKRKNGSMENHLGNLIEKIGEAFRGRIAAESRLYIEVDMGRQAQKHGFADLTDAYRSVFAIVPLKAPLPGMKVLIDGRTFIDYAQYASGVAVPGYVARNAGLPYTVYVPNESMILNFN
jgi:uncharacterized protein Veg